MTSKVKQYRDGDKGKHFLEVEFEKKFKQDEGLKDLGSQTNKNPKIGSKNLKKNFDVDECFFVKEDIPPQKLEIVKEVKQMIDPDYLG